MDSFEVDGHGNLGNDNLAENLPRHEGEGPALFTLRKVSSRDKRCRVQFRVLAEGVGIWGSGVGVGG